MQVTRLPCGAHAIGAGMGAQVGRAMAVRSARRCGFRNSASGFSGEVFSVEPTWKIYAHAKGDPFGHTRHRF